MDIPPEVLAAKNALEEPLLAAGLITGIDIGVRDEEQPDPEDLALRVFVVDAGAVPFEVQAALAGFPFPVVVLQRVFALTQDTSIHRPVVGGTSVASARFFATGQVPLGTLGALAHHATQPQRVFGLSNHHVLCADLGRQQGDEIIQPEPTPFGRVPGDRLGTLEDWVFSEAASFGGADAAICSIDVDWLAEIADIGFSPGTTLAQHAMMVSKRGRTTGRTFGWISGTNGTYGGDYPRLPAVGTPPSTMRFLRNQLQVHVDFPLSIVFGEHGDSGSVVVDPDNLAVGLYWGSGSDSLGDPLRYGVATPIQHVESALNISLQWSMPVIEEVDPPTAVAGQTIVVRGSGFLVTLGVDFGGTPAGDFAVEDDTTIAVQCPDVTGDFDLTVVTPAGSSEPVAVTVGV